MHHRGSSSAAIEISEMTVDYVDKGGGRLVETVFHQKLPQLAQFIHRHPVVQIGHKLDLLLHRLLAEAPNGLRPRHRRSQHEFDLSLRVVAYVFVLPFGLVWAALWNPRKVCRSYLRLWLPLRVARAFVIPYPSPGRPARRNGAQYLCPARSPRRRVQP